MLIVCPSCASEYTIEPGRLGLTGRVVRCAACREPWFIKSSEAQGDVPQIEPPRETVAASPGARKPRPAKSRAASAASRPRFTRPVAARLACVALIGLLAAAIPFRAACVRLVPGSASLFAALGLPVNLVGLSLTEVRSDVSQGPTGRVLTVKASIANPTGHTVHVPRLALSIGRADGESLYDWTAAPPETELAPGALARFETSIPSPPPEGRILALTFSTGSAAHKVASR